MENRRMMIVLMLLAFAGCDPISEPRPESEASIQTDQLTYEAEVASVPWRGGADLLESVEFTLIAALTNSYHEPVIVVRCGHEPPRWILERHVGHGWDEQQLGPGLCTDILILPQVVLMPGETRVDTLRAWGSLSDGAMPRIERNQVEGIYRLVYELREQGGPDCQACVGPLIPEEFRISNRFRVLKSD